MFAQEVHYYSVEEFLVDLSFLLQSVLLTAILAITRYSALNDVTMQRIGIAK